MTIVYSTSKTNYELFKKQRRGKCEDETQEEYEVRKKRMKQTRDMRRRIKQELGITGNGNKLTEQDFFKWIETQGKKNMGYVHEKQEQNRFKNKLVGDEEKIIVAEETKKITAHDEESKAKTAADETKKREEDVRKKLELIKLKQLDEKKIENEKDVKRREMICKIEEILMSYGM